VLAVGIGVLLGHMLATWLWWLTRAAQLSLHPPLLPSPLLEQLRRQALAPDASAPRESPHWLQNDFESLPYDVGDTDQAPFVQSLAPDWQRHWFKSTSNDSSSEYLTIANADCLLFHSTANRTACRLPQTRDDAVTEVHVAYSMCGTSILDTAMTSLKTLVLHRHSSVSLHVWLLLSPYDAVRSIIHSTLVRWPKHMRPHPINPTATHVFVHFLDLGLLMNSTSLLRRARVHLDLFRPCATTRLWLPQLLPVDLSLVLYLDCDTLVIRDYRQMLAHAQLFSPTQWLSFAYEGTSAQCGSWYILHPPAYPAPVPYAINSGVMLVNLTRWRSAETQAAFNEPVLLMLNGGTNNEVQTYDLEAFTSARIRKLRHSARATNVPLLLDGNPLGDQDVFNRWIGAQQQQHRSDVFFPLPFSYNWRECAMTSPGQARGVTLLHGNGNKFADVINEPFWAATYLSYFLWPRLPSNPTMRA